MSYKNILQEHFQKNGLPLPVYQTQPITPTDPSLATDPKQILGWSSTVYVNFSKVKDQFNIKNYTGNMSSTKTGAESNAASECLKALNLINTTSITAPYQPVLETTFNSADYRLEPGTFYKNFNLIDLENTPSFNVIPKKDVLYIGFINAHHHSLREYEKKWNIFKDFNNVVDHLKETYHRTDLYPNCLIITIMGGVTDLSDHLMTCWLLFLVDYLKLIPKDSTAIVNLCSRDHGIWCTKECLLKLLKFYQLDRIIDLNVVSGV